MAYTRLQRAETNRVVCPASARRCIPVRRNVDRQLIFLQVIIRTGGCALNS